MEPASAIPSATVPLFTSHSPRPLIHPHTTHLRHVVSHGLAVRDKARRRHRRSHPHRCVACPRTAPPPHPSAHVGFNVGVSVNSVPAILGSNLNPADLVTVWDAIYERGKAFAITLIFTTSFIFFLASYRSHQLHLQLPPTTFGLEQSTQLALAGAATFLAIPFTLLVLGPRCIKRLKAKVQAVGEAEKNGWARSTAVDAVEVRRDVQSWSAGNAVRAGIFATGFFLGATAL